MTEWFAIKAPPGHWPAVGDEVSLTGAPPPVWMFCHSTQGLCEVIKPGEQTKPGYIAEPVQAVVTSVTACAQDGPEFAIIEIA